MKNSSRLIACIMGQNCEKFIPMCLESVKDADIIVYCDGGSIDNTLNIVKKFKFMGDEIGVRIIKNKYDQEDKEMNGKQRNFYLRFLKENYPDDWCLCLDADEVVEDLSKIKEFILEMKEGLSSVKMRHFIGDLGHEDSTQKEHYVLNRLFKISDAGEYPYVEHPVLQPIKRPHITDLGLKTNEAPQYFTNCTTIWHLSYIPNMWEIKKKYENHLKKSNMHTPDFLKKWYYGHLFGKYPRKEFNILEIPETILNEFGIDKDELYFDARKNLDIKHFIDAIQLQDFLVEKTGYNHPKVFDYGCGIGQRVFAMNRVGLDAYGSELSDYAVKNSMNPDKIQQGDITKDKIEGKADLTMAYDVLEHLDYLTLPLAINNLINTSSRFILISIPFKGTPNCDIDPTHKIKESREWWIEKFKGVKLIETPNFLFKDQLLLFEKC